MIYLTQVCIFVFRDEGGFSHQLLAKRYNSVFAPTQEISLLLIIYHHCMSQHNK